MPLPEIPVARAVVAVAEPIAPFVPLPEVPVPGVPALVEIPGRVTFAFDDASVSPTHAGLQAVAQVLKAHEDVRVRVVGHTDAAGTDEYNLALSERRAQMVIDWLTANGIARDRMTATGLGEKSPVNTNETEAGRAENRCVELAVTR
jgi:outer membrane protein OmpA-like peptidoglycan-associated protein